MRTLSCKTGRQTQLHEELLHAVVGAWLHREFYFVFVHKAARFKEKNYRGERSCRWKEMLAVFSVCTFWCKNSPCLL